MATVREKFHELGNWHNKISMAAVVTGELLADKGIAKLPEHELKQVLDKAARNLKKIEQSAVGADKAVDEVKSFIYETVGADTQILPKGR